MSDADDPIRLRRWSLLCPHHRVRADLELEVRDGELVLLECSALDLAGGGRPCDERCLRSLGAAAGGPAGPAPTS